MPLARFDELYRDADQLRGPVPVVAAGGADRTVLEALRTACDRGWVSPLLTGSDRAIRDAGDGNGISLEGFSILDSDAPARAAVAEIRAGRARMLMKGQIATPDLMRVVLDHEAGLRTGRAICQVVLMEIPRDDRRFLLADTGILIHPNLTKKIDVLHSAVEMAQALGAPVPRVAMMAASEKAVDAMPETLHAQELQRRNAAGEFPQCVIQGPLSFDLAYASDAAGKKHIAGDVAGAADVMIFPDLASANLTVKAIMYTADCRFGGVLRGAACPVVFMSRADNTTTRLNSLALALRVLLSSPEGA
jgi:phosphotransacetylase